MPLRIVNKVVSYSTPTYKPPPFSVATFLCNQLYGFCYCTSTENLTFLSMNGVNVKAGRIQGKKGILGKVLHLLCTSIFIKGITLLLCWKYITHPSYSLLKGKQKKVCHSFTESWASRLNGLPSALRHDCIKENMLFGRLDLQQRMCHVKTR